MQDRHFDQMSNDLQFEHEIQDWDPALQFIARQVRQINKRCEPCLAQVTSHEGRLAAQENKTKKLFSDVAKLKPAKRSGVLSVLTPSAIASAVAMGVIAAYNFIKGGN